MLRASQVSRFAISSPHVGAGIGACVVVALLILAVLAFGPAGLDLPTGAAAALGGLLIPALLGAGASFNYYRQFGGTITARRCITLAATDLAVVLAFSIVALPFDGAAPGVWAWAILLAAAFASSVNMIVLAATADPNLGRALAPSLLMPAGCFAVFLGLGFITPLQFYLAVLFVVVFAAAAGLWVRIATGPFQRNFKESGLQLLHSILDAWAGWSTDGGDRGQAVGTLRMEEFFGRHGQPREVHFSALRLTKAGGKRLLWLAPELHPGPYADIGGSDLPAKAASALDGVADEFLVFHGPSTHDENPTGREQLGKVFAVVREQSREAHGASSASRAVRVKSEHFVVTAQRLGSALVLAQTRAPLSSDDIDAAVGREVREAGKRAGFVHTVLLDGHNSVEADLGRIIGGSPEARELVTLCESAASQVAKAPESALRAGWSTVEMEDAERREFAIGARGIVAAVTEASGQKMAWVLIDGNNLKGGLRTEMLEALRGKVDMAEVFTTDNHAVNTTMGADNEVGSRRDNVPLVKAVAKAVEAAVAGMADATAAPWEGAVPNVQVFGPGLTVRISATINAAVSVMVPAYLATSAAAVLACITMALLLT